MIDDIRKSDVTVKHKTRAAAKGLHLSFRHELGERKKKGFLGFFFFCFISFFFFGDLFSTYRTVQEVSTNATVFFGSHNTEKSKITRFMPKVP